MGAIDRLRAAMAPDPSHWEFTGEVRDAGAYGASSCACGHDIRYEFLIERGDGESLIIGSTCIEKYVPVLIAAGAKVLAKDLQAANVQFKREQRKKQQERLDESSLPGLEGDFAALRAWCLAARKTLLSVGFTPPEIPEVLRNVKQLPERGETAHETAGRIRRLHVSTWWEAVEAAQMWDELALPPTPEDRPSLARLRNGIGRSVANRKARLHDTALFAAAEYPTLAPEPG